jgi:hypothetical protein
METSFEDNESSKAYQELWNFNLQKIEDIQQDIEKAVMDMERRRHDFNDLYDGLAKRLDLLSSIYFSNIAIGGIEYVTRLRAVLRAYRNRPAGGEGPNFNLIHSLLTKIADARNRSVEQFPELSNLEYEAAARADAVSVKRRIRRKYSWASFKRNRSWFIVPFNTLDIRKNDNYPVDSSGKPDYIHVDIDNSIVLIKDIFSKFPDQWHSPAFYLLLNNGEKNFAADRLGKQIFANRDLLRPMLRPFAGAAAHQLSPGRVRLFGINHILLY